MLRRCVDKRKFQPEVHEQLRCQSKDPTVNSLGDYRVVAGAQQTEHRVDSRHPRGKNISALATFEFGHRALERLAIGMFGPRVIKALVFAELRLDVGGSLIDRRDDGAGGGIWFLSHMNRIGCETPDALLLVLAADR